MSFLPALLLWAGSFLVGQIFKPKVAYQRNNAEPQAFDRITVDDGRPIPVLWGTQRIKNVNMAWYGDISQVAIVQSGVTTGYHYYLGAQYPICMGPIDAIEGLSWNEKSVGKGITSANNQIVFGKTTPWTTVATIPVGNYGSPAGLAYAAEQAMKWAQNETWKVTFGFQIVAGRNDRIILALQYQNYEDPPLLWYDFRDISIPAGSYTGATLAAAIQLALYEYELARTTIIWTVTYSSNRFHLDMDAAEEVYRGLTGVYLCGADFPGVPDFAYAKTINSTIGFKMHVSKGATRLIDGDFDVLPSRFIFAFGGTGAKLKLTHAGFTSAAVFGFSTAADADIGSRNTDSDYSAIEAAYTPTDDYLQVDISDTDFFGTEGGVSGRLDVYWGKATQAESSYLTTKFGSTAPRWPRLCQAVQRGMYVGDTNVPKPISVTARRCPNQLGLTGERHNISGDANPACMIWELLTDTMWGAKIAEADLDKASFVAVGETLAAEGLGLSMLLDATGPAEDIADEILRHVGGTRWTNPLTGLKGIRLVRNDFSPAGVPVANGSNLDQCSLRRRSWGETTNVIRAKFLDRDSEFVERTVTVQDLASVESQDGQMAIQDVSFPGCSRRATAEIAANRLLKATSWPIAEVTLKADHTLWKLREGDPFVLTWAPLGILAMPCRVARLRSAGLSDGSIEIDAVEDVEGQAWLGFGGGVPAGETGYGIDYGLDYGGT